MDTLYTHTLGYKMNDIEAKCNVDSEDAYDMQKQLKVKLEGKIWHYGGCCDGNRYGKS
jgi:hypothetical protein